MTKQAGLIAKAIYGCIITLATLVGLEGKEASPSVAIVVILVSLVAVCSAEAFAHRLGSEVLSRRQSTLAEILEELFKTRWILLPGAISALVLFPVVFDLYSIGTGLVAAQILCCGVLFVIGYGIRRGIGGSRFWGLIDGVVFMAVGLSIVVLKILVK